MMKGGKTIEETKKGKLIGDRRRREKEREDMRGKRVDLVVERKCEKKRYQ